MGTAALGLELSKGSSATSTSQQQKHSCAWKKQNQASTWGTNTSQIIRFLWRLFDGGPIQGVVRNKINTGDLRSATVIDFLFGCVLFWKASISTFPLSTTWVFLGLLAGREIAIRWRLHLIDRQPLNAVLGRDVFKAGIGIVVSLAVAFAIQPLKAMG